MFIWRDSKESSGDWSLRSDGPSGRSERRGASTRITHDINIIKVSDSEGKEVFKKLLQNKSKFSFTTQIGQHLKKAASLNSASWPRPATGSKKTRTFGSTSDWWLRRASSQITRTWPRRSTSPISRSRASASRTWAPASSTFRKWTAKVRISFSRSFIYSGKQQDKPASGPGHHFPDSGHLSFGSLPDLQSAQILHPEKALLMHNLNRILL